MNETAYRYFVDTLGADAVLVDEPMAAHTTFRIGGPAEFFLCPSSTDEVVAIAAYCRSHEIPLHVLGRGSNLLVADEGLPGVVLYFGSRFARIEMLENGRLKAQAGATNSAIAHKALECALAGFECLAGIPGTIGGAAVMNAGAYGGELKDVATSVSCLMPDGNVRCVQAADAGWGYRTSSFVNDGSIILDVELQLQAGDASSIKALMDDLANRRREKQPVEMPSAGSTFKRPDGYFAGKLIQDAGLQGRQIGGAQVSTKHAGFVVNVGGASAADVRQLIDEVAETVAVQAGVELEPEVRFWGF